MKKKNEFITGITAKLICFISLLVLLPNYALAQINPLNDKTIQQGMSQAPAIATASGLRCDVINAVFIGNTTSKNENSSLKGKTYEVACKDSDGWIITKYDNGTYDIPMDCTSAATYLEKNKNFPNCRLPQNVPHYKWLNQRIQAYLPNCTVSKARLSGANLEKKLSRFEVLCSDGRGGNIDILGSITSNSFEFKDCLMVEKTSSICKLQSKQQTLNQFKPLISQADKQCTVNNLRFIGPSADLDSLFFEVGCSNKSGFVIVSDLKYNLKEQRSCVTFADSKSPCQFTSIDNLAKEENQKYTQLLANNKINCNVTQFNFIGTQTSTKRDYIEFLCPEQPFGLIGLVPQPESKAEIFMMDCFTAQLKSNKCSLTSPDFLKAHINTLVNKTIPQRNCVVKEVRYEGESSYAKDFIIVEAACENKRGYMIEINDKRTEISSHKACRLLKGSLKCTIPGNGTYSSDDS